MLIVSFAVQTLLTCDLFTKFIAEPLAKLVETVFCFTITTPMIAQGAFVLILASNFFYVLYNQMRYKESILAGLLDDTIL